jgi:peptide/nickel transport system permease protein
VGTRRYVITKILQACLTLVFILAFNFFLFRVMPGDPAATLLRGSSAFNPDNLAQEREDLGLDAPLPEQFATYMVDMATLNFGDSFFLQGQPVIEVIANGLWPTVLLVGTSTAASAVIGLAIGIRGAWRRGSTFDVGSLGATLVLYSMPEFWFGMLVLMAFAGGVGPFPALFPVNGYSTIGQDYTGVQHVADVLNHMVLPWLVLTLVYLGEFSLIMRSSLLDVLGDHFVHTARAKGLLEKQVLWRHAVPNALLPTVTIIVLSLGFIFQGAITVEFVFGWPGLGWLTVQAVDNQDFALLQGLFFLFSVGVLIANLAADLTYAYLDPRVRAQ